MVGSRLIKIQFYDPDVGYENLWAENVGGQHYQLKSVPFFIYGIAVDDVVRAIPDDEGRLQYTNTLSHSGNRTLRARSEVFQRDRTVLDGIIQWLEEKGCDTETLNDRLVAINVPTSLELGVITKYLTERNLSWEFGHPDELNK